ncbi:MAG: isoprenylcysteine carboxylmethyltransferase family protein [Alphaproteobacteria bacterium]|nr:isoprenylcysteine carboxylmethyltransferase family protein [Alphaproteobacteria bacterium]
MAFNVVVTYAIGFLGNFLVPVTVDEGRTAATVWAGAVDIVLLVLFGLQHSVMARPRFKAWMTRLIPPPIERSTYVLISSVALALVMWQWRPIPVVVWRLESIPAQTVLYGLFALGWITTFYATFLTDHNELFGLRQVYDWLHDRPRPPAKFQAASLYRFVRHPIMSGQLVAFWAAPTMTAGHLLFSSVMSAYILIGIHFEERDLGAALGDDYQQYRSRTPKLIPRIPRGR